MEAYVLVLVQLAEKSQSGGGFYVQEGVLCTRQLQTKMSQIRRLERQTEWPKLDKIERRMQCRGPGCSEETIDAVDLLRVKEIMPNQ